MSSLVHEWHSSVIPWNSDFYSRFLPWTPEGRSPSPRHKQDPADEDKAHSQGLISNHPDKKKPGHPCNPIYSTSRVTQQAHIRPLHFLCWGSFLLPWGCEDYSSLWLCLCRIHCYRPLKVCERGRESSTARDTKEGDLIWHERRLHLVPTGVNWRVHNADRTVVVCSVIWVTFLC